MEQYALYLVLRDLLNNLSNRFSYSFNDMDSNEDRAAGIYVKGAEPSKYRTISRGQYLNNVNRVQFLIQGGLDKNSLMESLELGSKIKEALVTASNTRIDAPSEIYIDADGSLKLKNQNNGESTVYVLITDVRMISDLVSLGKSEQGRPRYSINFKVNYSVGGK